MVLTLWPAASDIKWSNIRNFNDSFEVYSGKQFLNVIIFLKRVFLDALLILIYRIINLIYRNKRELSIPVVFQILSYIIIYFRSFFLENVLA